MREHRVCPTAMEVTELQKTVTELRAANVELGATVTELEEERERYRALYQEMLEKARKLELGLLGQKSERMPTSELQLSLQLLAGLLGEQEFVLDDDDDENDADDDVSATRGRHRRR